MNENLQKYWDELLESISDVETHGDAIQFVRDALLTSGDVASLTAERDSIAAERDSIAAERDEYKAKFEAAQNEIRSRWKDLTNGGSITVETNFTAPKAGETAATIADLDFSEMNLFDGGTE